MFTGLNKDTIHSLIGFMNAPAMEKRCLYVIASRTHPSDLRQYRDAFYDADTDGDGRISRYDLTYLLEQSWRLFSLWVNVDTLFKALDVTNTGVITYTEFVAACLHSRLSPLDSWLAEQAFESMDLDKDGLVQPEQVRDMFGVLPQGLPGTRAFDLDEWLECLLNGSTGRINNSKAAASSSTNSAELSSKKSSFFQQLFFGGLNGCCTKGSDEHMIEHVMAEPWDTGAHAKRPSQPQVAVGSGYAKDRALQPSSRFVIDPVHHQSAVYGLEGMGSRSLSRDYDFHSAPRSAMSSELLSSPSYVSVGSY